MAGTSLGLASDPSGASRKNETISSSDAHGQQGDELDQQQVRPGVDLVHLLGLDLLDAGGRARARACGGCGSLAAGTPMEPEPLPPPSEAATRAARSSGVRRPPPAPPASAGAAVLVATPPPPSALAERLERLGGLVGGLGPEALALGDLGRADAGGLGLGPSHALGRAVGDQAVVDRLIHLDLFRHRVSPLAVVAGPVRAGSRRVCHRGPEMPPSLRIRQKWTARKMTVTNGMNRTWSTYQRSRVAGPIETPPRSTNCTCSPKTGV